MKIKKILISTTCIILSLSLFFSLFKLYKIHDSLSVNQYVTYYSRSEIPNKYKWDTSHIYASKEELDDEIDNANNLLALCMTDLRELDEGNINKLLDDYFTLEQKAIKLSNYLQLYELIGEDDAVEQKNTIKSIYQKTSSIYSFVCSIIISFSPMEIEQIYTDSTKYQKVIENIRKHKEEINGDENLNNIINQIKQNYNTLTDLIDFPSIKYSDGSTLDLSYPTFILSMQNKNRDLRKNVYTTYYETYKDNFENLAENLLNYTFFCDLYCKTKGFDSTLDFCLWKTGVNENVYDSSVNVVVDNIELFSRYNQRKSEILSVEKFQMYDVYVSPYKDRNIYIPYEEAKEIIINALTPLGEEYIAVVKRAFEENWVDVYSSRDKEDNSLQIDFYDVHPYILINYQGTENDLYTLIHEIGHSVQSYALSQEYEYWESGVPEFLIEVSSTLNEILLSEYLLRSSLNDGERINNAFSYLEKIKTNVFRQAQITMFESEIYNNKTVDAGNINDIYKRINDWFYNGTVNSDELISYEWCRLSSLYMNFYAYQYITSFGAAMQIYDSLDTKKECLTIGKYDDPIQFMKQYDIDFESKDMYSALFDKMEQLLVIVE